jgi:hypothetical protein
MTVRNHVDEERDMARFEEVFRIPEVHTLKQTYFKSSANGSRDRWMHEEYDAHGALVARYESWMNLTINGFAHDDGWKKFSPTGEIVATGDDLPI